MPDHRRHRGPDPEDAASFAPAARPALRSAVADLSWLLSRGYATPSATKLVGDRYNLTARQRTAVQRCAAPDEAIVWRTARRLTPGQAAGRPLLLDGYNVLTTVEAALAGGVLLLARDGCLRDLASVHGTWRSVEETRPALRLAAATLGRLGATPVTWFLDSPVSNSGRLKAILLESAAEAGHAWTVELVGDPDPILAASADPVATADSVILDRCGPWLNLARLIVEHHLPHADVIDLA